MTRQKTFPEEEHESTLQRQQRRQRDFEQGLEFWRAKAAVDAGCYVPLAVLVAVLFVWGVLALVFGR